MGEWPSLYKGEGVDYSHAARPPAALSPFNLYLEFTT